MIKLGTENRPASELGKATADLGDELLGDCNVTSDIIQAIGTNQSDVESANAAFAVSIREQLEHHPHFRGRTFLIQIELIESTIVLSGCLPTHYLKQLLQEAIRLMPGVADVDNRVLVMRPNQ